MVASRFPLAKDLIQIFLFALNYVLSSKLKRTALNERIPMAFMNSKKTVFEKHSPLQNECLHRTGFLMKTD